MENNIKIDIVNKSNLLEKYNENKISRDVIEYLIKEAMLIDRNEKAKIIINKDRSLFEHNCKELIKVGLKDEYKRSIEKQHDNNIKQLYLFILGVILLFLSTIIKEEGIWKEILLISGWVPIWEIVKIEIFPDVEGRIKRKIIKKLLKSEIVERI